MSNLMKRLTIGDASYEICDASAREALEKIGTGGGSGGMFVVTVTEDMESDKTYDEIFAAYNNGNVVILLDPFGAVYQLNGCYDGSIEFSSTCIIDNIVWCQVININQDNVVTVTGHDVNDDNLSRLLVEVDIDCVSNFGYSEVRDAIENGREVVVKHGDYYYYLDFVGECKPGIQGIVFSRIESQLKYTLTYLNDTSWRLHYDQLDNYMRKSHEIVLDDVLTYEAGSRESTGEPHYVPQLNYDNGINETYEVTSIVVFWDGDRYTPIFTKLDDGYTYCGSLPEHPNLAYGEEYPFGIKISPEFEGECKMQILLPNAAESEETHEVQVYFNTTLTYIPEIIVRSNCIPEIADLTTAPTKEDFNNLLAALRNAGLMVTE